jgi:hypothetical protein
LKAILIRPDRNMDAVRQKTVAVALSYRPSTMDVLELMKKGKSIRYIFVPKSQMETIGQATKRTAEDNGVTLTTSPKDFRGIRTDLNGPEIEIEYDEENENKEV